MIDFERLFREFFSLVAEGKVDIYNEFSVQHELGVHLRRSLSRDLPSIKVQFERPVSFFGLERSDFVKKEIDISVFTSDWSIKHAVELKYPRRGQYPEQMYSACKDIRFLEQLCRNGFGKCFFIVVADDPTFYEERTKTTGIYRYFRGPGFRGHAPLCGVIRKPTGRSDLSVELEGVYYIVWNPVKARMRYTVVEIRSIQAS